ncbi:unnamed protein product [Adineta steineri]|uniref:Uncharacterized protein n=1 Tax=Adineta steineri TaxID=433720 RepID=A0A815M5P9_9BILA|nr:unnamed protein product [Adineta steineri]CAF1619094.1 unnamed protein product [Adineta steineri]
MPITTHVGALRSQINATTTVIVNKAILKGQVRAQTSTALLDTLECSIINQQRSISQTGLILQVNSVGDRTEKQLEEDVDMPLESSFRDQDLVSSTTTSKEKVIEQKINKPTSPSSLVVLSKLSSDSILSSITTEVIKEAHPVLLFASSNENESDVTSNPVVKRDIIVG